MLLWQLMTINNLKHTTNHLQISKLPILRINFLNHFQNDQLENNILIIIPNWKYEIVFHLKKWGCLLFTTKFRFLLLNMTANRIFVKTTVGTDFIIGPWPINNVRWVNYNKTSCLSCRFIFFTFQEASSSPSPVPAKTPPEPSLCLSQVLKTPAW